MDGAAEIETPRLRLRRWRAEDRAPFAALNRDPAVVEFLPEPLSRIESDAFVDRCERHFADHGFGPWVVEERDGAAFAGYVGLLVPGFPAPFTPCVEIGWRLARAAWGRGIASEAAGAVLAHAFGALALEGVVSFTVPGNRRSRRVMERIGLVRDPTEDFDHPRLPPGHPLRRHVLYRARAASWRPPGPAATRADRAPRSIPGGPPPLRRPHPPETDPAGARSCQAGSMGST